MKMLCEDFHIQLLPVGGDQLLDIAVARKKNIEVIRYLVERGASVNSPGGSPLATAIAFGDFKVTLSCSQQAFQAIQVPETRTRRFNSCASMELSTGQTFLPDHNRKHAALGSVGYTYPHTHVSNQIVAGICSKTGR